MAKQTICIVLLCGLVLTTLLTVNGCGRKPAYLEQPDTQESDKRYPGRYPKDSTIIFEK